VSRKHDAYEEMVASKSWDSAIFRRLLRYARPHTKLFVASFSILLALHGLELIGPWIVRAVVDGPVRGALDAREVAAGTGVEPDVTTHVHDLYMLVGGYLAVVALATWLRYLEVAQLGRTGQAVIHDVRTKLFAHIQRLDLAWFDRRPTGALVTRVTGDVENLNELFTSGIIVLLFDLLKIVVFLSVLLFIDVELALIVVAMTPALIGVSLVFLQEVLSGIRVVQMFSRERRVSKRFASDLAEYLSANFRTIFLFALFYPVIAFVSSSISGAIVWRGGHLIVEGSFTYGEFLQFWLYLGLLLGPIQQLGERYNVLQAAFASAERIFEVLDTEPVVEERGNALQQPFRAHVRFENVSFAYQGSGREVTVLDDVSFEIPPGETVALVGATGAGKSTIVSLLLRFYDPTKGRITIDGVDLRELDLAELRSRLGLVQQDDFLFTGTVRENLELGRARVNPQTLAAALETSTAGDLVSRLPHGLDSEVAERGVTLSTGERELLAIARALAGDPRLVVLDEATSSVDSATEARIEEATLALLRGRSALVVAHRLSTVQRSDNILVLHHGVLRESGTHRELLARGGLYARLYAMQFRDEDADAG
jgi:ATP-binding cassette subfamily B protein